MPIVRTRWSWHHNRTNTEGSFNHCQDQTTLTWTSASMTWRILRQQFYLTSFVQGFKHQKLSSLFIPGVIQLSGGFFRFFGLFLIVILGCTASDKRGWCFRFCCCSKHSAPGSALGSGTYTNFALATWGCPMRTCVKSQPIRILGLLGGYIGTRPPDSG